FIKVDHAGEHGAVCIYSGQLVIARLTAPGLVKELAEFRRHERQHREVFRSQLASRGWRRCRSYWLCGLGGLVLGLMTGLFGPRAIAATTVAVERVVLRHLEDQVSTLEGIDPDAAAAILSIVADERSHHERSLVHVQASKFW